MEKFPVAELDFSKLDGLITVVTQASETGKVLMQAYANREGIGVDPFQRLCPLLVTITEKALEERRKFRKCPENQPDFGGLRR